jgi:hypothetical protein
MNIAWGIDFHVWDLYRGRLQYLADHGMTFAIFKTTMGFGDVDRATIDAFVQEATAAGLIWGFYGWIDPTGNVTDELKRFGTQIAGYKPHITAADAEQTWSNWQKYFDFCAGTIGWDAVPKLSQAQINSFTSQYMAGLRAIKGDVDELDCIYTNLGYVGTWMPQATAWLVPSQTQPGYPLWDAGTPYYGTPVKFTNWELFNVWLGARPVAASSIKGMKRKMHQISSQVWLPGFTGPWDNSDFDLWVAPDGSWGTPEQMRAELMGGAVIVPPPALTMGEKVDVLWADWIKTHPQS